MHTLLVDMFAYYHDNLLLDTNLFQKTILRNDYEKCLEALLLRC
jgi:hypothetical protein